MRAIAAILRTMRWFISRRGIKGAIGALVIVLAVAGCQAAESLAGPTWHWAAQGETNATGQPIEADPATT